MLDGVRDALALDDLGNAQELAAEPLNLMRSDESRFIAEDTAALDDAIRLLAGISWGQGGFGRGLRWKPMDSRGAWSAIGGVLFGVCATNAVAWGVASAPADSPLPPWPVVVFAGFAVVGFYTAAAALLRRWPFGMLQSTGELLDDCIRDGRAARERITREGLADNDAIFEYSLWFLRTSNMLEARVPALADKFNRARSVDFDTPPKRHMVVLINMQLDVLTEARKV